MLNYVCNEHDIIRFSEDGSCLRLSDVEGIDFIGPPDNRDPFNREAPKYLGLSRSEEGLKAHYYIGTSWLKEGHISVSVLPKLNTQTCRINFAAMLGVALEIDEIRNANYFSQCYGISFNEKSIEAGGIADDFLVLLVMHYTSLLQRIVASGLRRDYLTIEENMKSKVKGRILLSRNIVLNDMNQRPDRVYCSYQVYTDDIPENRLLKKALIASERIIMRVKSLSGNNDLRHRVLKLKTAFNDISTDVYENQVRAVKASKLYRGYDDAIKVAKMILRQQANDTDASKGLLPPFWIDMTGLFELYVYSLLEKAYPKQVLFQAPGSHKTRCDYLHLRNKMIMDAKYKPGYSFREEDSKVYRPMDDIREISGYARDMTLLKRMGEGESFIPRCMIIYPDQKNGIAGFAGTDLGEQGIEIKEFSRFYRLGVKLPVK